MATRKITRKDPHSSPKETSELFTTDCEITEDNDADQNRPAAKETESHELSGGLKLIPGETLIKTMDGFVEGQPMNIKVYYGNYILPMINERFRPLKPEVYQNFLEEFLESEEGKRYDRPSAEENKEALAEVKRVTEAYLKKQELLRSSNILEPGRTMPAAEEVPEQEKPEEEKKEEPVFIDDIPSEEAKAVEFIKNKNYTRQQIREIRKGLDSEKRRSALGTVAIITVALAILVFAVFLIKDVLIRAYAVIELELKQSEITVRAGDSFTASDYVKHVTEDESIYIIYPTLDTKDIGAHNLDYVATNGIKSVRKTMIANVIDGESPVIVLIDEEILLVRGRDEESFDPMSYIREMSDNLDEELEAEVNPLDWSKDEQSLTYRVKDSSGNTGKAILLVKIEDKAVCDKNATYNAATNTCKCKSGYTGDGTACKIVSSGSSSSDSGSSGGSSGNGGGNSGSSGNSSGGESWTVDYTDYQPSNGQYDVTYTNNDTGESYTVSDGGSDPYESDEDLWAEIDNLGN